MHLYAIGANDSPGLEPIKPALRLILKKISFLG